MIILIITVFIFMFTHKRPSPSISKGLPIATENDSESNETRDIEMPTYPPPEHEEVVSSKNHDPEKQKLSVIKEPGQPTEEASTTDKNITSSDVPADAKSAMLNKTESPIIFNWNKVTQEQAANAVDALYNAILWRKPDTAGGTKAIDKFTSEGWANFVGAAKGMITSREFSSRIVPKHSTQSIIHRMYAVFLKRCANSTELRDHFAALKEDDPGRIPFTILNQVKNADDRQIFSGGYDPSSCALAK